MMAAMLVLASCSKDDEPGKNTSDGVSDYINAVDMLYYSEGPDAAKPRFTPSDTEGLYLAQATSKESCYQWVEELIGAKWDGSDKTVRFDEHSSIRLTGQSAEMAAEGIYAELVVDFTDYIPFTLQIITAEKAGNYENGVGRDIIIIK